MTYTLLSKLYYKDKSAYLKLCEERKNSENTKFLNMKIHDNDAFYCLCPDIYDLTTKIMELDKKVFKIRKELPQVAISQFTRKSLIDEIILTNDIEGVYSTRKEIGVILDNSNQTQTNRFYGLVTKYEMLNIENLSLSTCQDIRNIYDELVLPEISEDNAENIPDGKIFRKDLAEVTTKTQKVIHKGVYPESKIIDCMEQALKVLKDESINSIIRIAVFHYLFGYIHPFYDGNGRTSRFISSYLLAEEYEFLIGYRLSYTIKENINQYYEAFKICNDEKNCGDITPFVITFLGIVCKSFENLYEALCKRASLLDEGYSRLKENQLFEDKELEELAYILLQAALFSREGINKNSLCMVLGISISTLDKRLAKVGDFLSIQKIGKVKYYSFNIEKL